MSKVIPINGAKLRMPGLRDRISIIGPTGSGKSHAGLFHLSIAPFTEQPYVVIDPKREELLQQIEGAEYRDVGDLPKDSGIYIYNPVPSQADDVNQMLLDIWERERIGVWIDEGLMFGTGDGIDACFTQGRSKRIPMIMLMQRPVWVSRFAVSEATFIQYFGLTDKRDQATVSAFAPNLPVDTHLEQFHSFYYDVPRKQNFHFKPMPKADVILSRLDERLATLKPQRKII